MIEPVRINLDRLRAIKWTARAEARLGSLERPPRYRDLASRDPHRAFYALCACLWAALVPADSAEFATYESVAECLGEKDQQGQAFEGMVRALRDAGVIAEKKTPKDESAAGSVGSVSTNGPLLSSNSAPVPVTRPN